MARKKETNPESIIEGFDFSDDYTVENIPIQNDSLHNPAHNIYEKRKVGRPKGTVKKTEAEKAKHFSTTLPPDIISLLSSQAEKEDRPVSRIIASAIRFYVENH